jgi:hypothetical protein
MRISKIFNEWPRWAQQKYFEGAVAFMHRLPLSKNPDPPDSENGFFWDLGWADAGWRLNETFRQLLKN